MSKMVGEIVLGLLLLPPAVLCAAAADQATANAIKFRYT